MQERWAFPTSRITLAAIVLKKIWNDPVWSKVIAAGIVAAGGLFSTYRLNWWPGWITRRLASLWAYLLSPSTVPHWLLVLLGLVGIPIIVLATVLVWIAVFPKATAPNWTSYTTDLFDGLRWRWRYANGCVDRLLSFCPHCDFQVYPDNTSPFAVIINFHCESCGRNLGTCEGPDNRLNSRVTRLIQQKLRAGTWREVSPDLSLENPLR